MKPAKFLATQWLQTLPISNPNRDRTGAPKTTYFGGVMRGRISSQCWSRQVRELFNQNWEGDVGKRSRLWADRLAQEFQTTFGYDRQTALAAAFLTLSVTGAKADSAATFRAGQTDVLLFLSNVELQEIVAIAHRYKKQLDRVLEELGPYIAHTLDQEKAPSLELNESKAKKRGKSKNGAAKEAQNVLSSLKEFHEDIGRLLAGHRSSADIALFGRFMASFTEANVDGALLRSPMVTTHAVAVETDFWTAMDDFKNTSRDEEDEESEEKASSGAGHLGERPQTSGVYACSCALDIGQLRENLGQDGDDKKVIRTFLSALIVAPRSKGYIHQFYHRSLPNLFIAELTEACPLNCLTAFEKPVAAGKNSGYLEPSVQRLDQWWHSQNTLLQGLVETKTCAVVDQGLRAQLSHLTPHLKTNYNDLIETVVVWLGD